MRVLVIIPAYNEAESLVQVVNDLKRKLPPEGYDYVLVNDCSRDATAKLCREHGFNHISLPLNLGLPGAMRTGFRYAYRKGYDVAVQIDGDGQHRPEYIPALIAEIEKGADIAIGSRFLTHPKPWTARMAGSRLLAWAIKLTTGVTLTDPTSGMRALNRQQIADFANNMNYPPQADAIAYQIKRGAVVREIQVEMDDRTTGASYFSFVTSIKYMMQKLTAILLIQGFRKAK